MKFPVEVRNSSMNNYLDFQSNNSDVSWQRFALCKCYLPYFPPEQLACQNGVHKNTETSTLKSIYTSKRINRDGYRYLNAIGLGQVQGVQALRTNPGVQWIQSSHSSVFILFWRRCRAALLEFIIKFRISFQSLMPIGFSCRKLRTSFFSASNNNISSCV